jgi:hypothetical protein
MSVSEQGGGATGNRDPRRGDANALVELAGLPSWGRSPGAARCPRQGKTWQDDAATVGSLGFEVTMSLWHLGRVSNPRSAEIGSVS